MKFKSTSILFAALTLLLILSCGYFLPSTPESISVLESTLTPKPIITLEPTLTQEPTPTPEPTLTAGEQVRMLAETGVTANADWTPYTEEIDGVLMALVPAGCFPMGSTDEEIADAMELLRDRSEVCIRQTLPTHPGMRMRSRSTRSVSNSLSGSM